MKSNLYNGCVNILRETSIYMSFFFFLLPVVSIAENISFQQNHFSKYYKGRLGHYPIELFIQKKGNQLSGAYIQRYRHNQRAVELEGVMDEKGEFKLKGQGIFSGHFVNGKMLGYWYRSEDSREKYPFSLEEKKPDYYNKTYWKRFFLCSDQTLNLPVNSRIDTIDKDQFMNDRKVLSQEMEKKVDLMQEAFYLSFPIKDSSIVSKYYMEIACYYQIDSLEDFLSWDTISRYSTHNMLISGKKIQVLDYTEGTTGGSYHSRIYFYKDPQTERSYLFHLFYSYSNPWMFGNPYSREEYKGPFINDLNKLVEIPEMMIGSL